MVRRVRRTGLDWTPGLAVLAIGLVLALGQRIPNPGLALGLDPDPYAAPFGSAVHPPILWLGLEPLLSVLLMLELFKLVAPKFAGWTNEVSPGRAPMTSAITAIALGIATIQAIHLSRSINPEAWSADRDLAFLVSVASFVAGAALSIWLTRLVHLPGLASAGLWIVLSLGTVAELAYQGPALTDAFEQSALPFYGIAIASAVLAVAALVFTANALARSVRRAGGDPFVWSPILVWPPFISLTLALPLAAIIQESGFLPIELSLDRPLYIVAAAMAFTVPVVVCLQARSIARVFPDGANWSGKRIVLTCLALQQVVICGGLSMTTMIWPLPHGPSLIALVVVVWALRDTMQTGRVLQPIHAPRTRHPRIAMR